MANRISMGEKEAIIRLFENGWKKRRIARELGLDRNTVRSHIRAFELSNSPISPAGTDGSNSPIMPAGNIGAQSRRMEEKIISHKATKNTKEDF